MRKLFDKIFKKKVYLIALILITIGFHFSYGLKILLPGNINWLLSVYHDWGQHYLGWAYFREEPWHFPLGHVDNYNYPAGTNVGFTDSIPLLALFFKTVSFLLPKTFQYLGFWLFACHLLTGFFTIKIFKIYKIKNIFIILGVIIIALNPMLIYRGLHPALCGHWLIIASLYYYLKPATFENVKRNNFKQIILLIVSSLVNPYLFAMVIGFNFILPLKNYFYDKKLPLKTAIIYFLTSIILVLLGWYVVGMLTFNDDVKLEVANGYGIYGFNLNYFFNSGGFASILPQMKLATEQQYEGFAYLGLGMLILLLTMFLYVIIKLIFYKKNMFKNQSLLPLFVLTLFLTVFAITNKVTYNENTLFSFDVPEIILKIGGVFRASARFIWLLYYLFLFFSIIIFAKIKMNNTIKVVLFSIILITQLYDIKMFFTFRNLPSGNYEITKISESNWTSIFSKFDKIITYPPFQNNLLYPLDYQDLCYVALKYKLPISTGYVARETSDVNRKFIDSLKIDLDETVIGKNNLYITTPTYIEDFYLTLYKKKAKLLYQDGFYCLYSSDTKFQFKNTQVEKDKVDSLYKQIQKAFNIQTIPKPTFLKNRIKYSLENNSFSNNILHVKGWAFLKESKDNRNDSIYVFLTNDQKTYIMKAKSFQRPDVSNDFTQGNLNNSGFSASFFSDNIEENKYALGIAIKKENKWIYEIIDGAQVNMKKPRLPIILTKKPVNSGKIILNIEETREQAGNILIKGWAAIENQDATDSQTKIVLISESIIYEIDTESFLREDVTNSLKNYNYNDSGFIMKMRKEEFRNGEYKIAIIITDQSGKVATHISDKSLTINNKNKNK